MGTPARSLGTDTFPRIRAWCLSPSEPGQAPSKTTSQSLNRMVTDRAASPPAWVPGQPRPGLSQRRIP